MRTKFQIMRDRRNASSVKKLANAYDVEKARERAVLMGVSGLLEKRSVLWPSSFYDAKTNGDLHQYGLGLRFGELSLPPSKNSENADLGMAPLQRSNVHVQGSPSRNVGVWRSYAGQFAMRVRELCKKFAQLFR